MEIIYHVLLIIEPDVVKNLTAGIITTTSISLSWEKPYGNASFYEIQILGEPSLNRTVNTTFDTIDGLIPGNYYTLLVSAVVGENNITGNSSHLLVYTKPDVVKNLTAGIISTTSISLRWGKPYGNASFYEIQILGEPSLNRTVNTTFDTIDGLIPGNYYTLLVSAVVGENNITGNISQLLVYTKPDVVKNLTAGIITTTSISLSWEKPYGNASFYEIQILGEPSLNRTVNTTFDTIDGLIPGNYYTLLVSAVVGENNITGNSSHLLVYTKPDVVKNLTAGIISTTSISLRWGKPYGNASFYEIQILGEPSLYRTVNTTFVTIDGLIAGNYYTLLVSAVVGENNITGNISQLLVYTKPDVVKNLTAGIITTTSISLSWEKPYGNASFYEIQILGEPSLNRTVNTTFDTIDGLIPGNYYTLLVSAVVGENNITGNSSHLLVYTKPDVVKNLTAGIISTMSISLRWGKPYGNASFYEIQILGEPSLNRTVNTTFDTIDGLIPGNYYTLLVSAVVGENNITGNISQLLVYTKPDVVKNLTAGIITTTSISLSWEKPYGNASFYEIQILGEPSLNRTVNTNFDTIDGLIPGNYYTLLVSAVVGENNITGHSSHLLVYTKPDVVKNLTAGIIFTTSISLRWGKPYGNASFYEIQILGEPSLNRTVNTTFDTIDGLIPGNYYTLLVSAVVGENNITGNSSHLLVYTKPDVVKNLTAGIISTTSISLRWGKPYGNASFYEIQILGEPSLNRTVNTTFDTIDGLIPGNYYTLLVSAVVGENNITGNISQLLVYTKPDVVKNLTAGIITTTSISLSWEKPYGNASFYEIQVLGEPSLNRTVNTNFDTIDGLIPGNYYTLQVSAVVGENNITGNSSHLLVYTKPDVVKNLTAGIISTTSISLRWGKPYGNASFYEIQILGEPSLNRTVNTTFDTIDGLIPGNYYTLLVSAVVGENNITGNISQLLVYTKPDVVKNLTAGIITTTSISLSWEKPYGNASFYEIQILGEPSLNRTVNTNFDTIDGLIPGNYYTLQVSAVVGENNITGNSSHLLVYTKPDVVKNLTAGIIFTTSISLRWGKPYGNASFYEIQILGEPSLNRTVNTTFDTIDGLIPGNYYTLLVSAVVGENNITGNISQLLVYTKPDVVKNLTAGIITTTSISLSWEKPYGNASFYEIQILGEPSLNRTVNTNFDTIDGLIPGNYYTLQVSAVVGENNITGNSSHLLVYTKPDVVKNLTAGIISTTSISLRWGKPYGNASFYEIQILGEPSLNRTVNTTFDTIDGLIPGNYYTLLVSAVVGENNITGNISQLLVYTKPDVVKNLTAGIITTTSISLSWEKPYGNASFYEIQILGEPSLNRTVNTNFDTIDGLIPGNYYTLLVSAVVGENNITGNSSHLLVYTKPDVVKNLTAGIISTTSISLRWGKPYGNASFYEIQILGEPSLNRTVNTTFDTIDGLIPGNYYTLLVSAVVGENNITGNISQLLVYTKPDVVKNLTAGIITTTSISLSWEKPYGNASFYEIQILGEPSLNRTVNTNFDTIDGLIPGNYYTLLVSAVVGENNITGNSSHLLVYTKPDVVKNLTAGIISTTSISLRWGKPYGNASFYEIQILGEPSLNRTVNTTFDTIDGLIPGNYYTLLVSAVVGENNITGNSSHLLVYTKPDVVKNLTAGIISTTSISLRWGKPYGNASFYEIQILGEPSLNRTVNTTFDTIDGLIPGNYYTLLVSAVVGENNITGNSSHLLVYTKPDVVKNLTAGIISTTSISLRWGKPYGNASFYEIQILGEPSLNRTVNTTFDTIDGLIPGNYYTLLVSAVVGENNITGNISQLLVYTKPDVVKNLTAGIITTTSISLSWEKPYGNASFYEIQILGEPSLNRTVNTNFDTIDGLIPGNYYTLLVSAVVGENNITGNSSHLLVYTKPDVVKNLTAGIISTTSISLRWGKPYGNASFYEIQILGEPSLNRTVNTTFDTIDGLIPGNYYTLLVSAVVGENNITGNSSHLLVYTKPDVVKNLTAGIISTTSISLRWGKPYGNASFYEIQILGEPSLNRTVNTTFDTIDGLIPGNYYTLLVSAVVGENNITGNISQLLVYTKPDVVKNLTAGIITTTSISLSWEKPYGNASFYEIQILGEPSLNRTVNTNFDTIDGLIPGNYYTLLVSAVVGENNITGNSSHLLVYTKPDVVKNLTAGIISTTSISLRWGKPYGNASFYEIQILGEPSLNRTVNTTFDTIDGLIPGNYYTLLVSAVVGENNITGNSSHLLVYT
ncbi:receptor-type tyrosine-protein phosphatase beta-like, partial [Bufo bufo]|uniref:receptor-type tyrosine-protein phosphatase beta-like n=1 Tax=Bufo bufo TaxID=8384 RepID=UPI001ABE2F75